MSLTYKFTSHPTTSGHWELSQISKQKHSDNMHCTVSVDSTEAIKCMKSLTWHVWFTVTKTVSRVHVLELIYIARTLQYINQSPGDGGNSVVERLESKGSLWSKLVAGSIPAARVELVFFSRANFLCFLLFRYLLHSCQTRYRGM